ncbi:MAG: cupin domain-containing protein [Flavobacteriales bacterium]|nr:cupin domain-containing protein [Flavobacteriales bacterium]
MKVNYKNKDWDAGRVKGFFGKDLLNLEHGGVKIVKVAPHSTYPVHIHPDKTEFLYLLEGNLICSVEENEFECQKDDFLVFPHKQKHSIKNNTDKTALAIVGNIKI